MFLVTFTLRYSEIIGDDLLYCIVRATQTISTKINSGAIPKYQNCDTTEINHVDG